ncbi:MAG: hypothetical protein PVF22_01475 [Candidatus Aminicenantes bacterium]
MGLVIAKRFKNSQYFQEGELRKIEVVEKMCCDRRVLEMTGWTGFRPLNTVFCVQKVYGQGGGNEKNQQENSDIFPPVNDHKTHCS